MYHTIQLLLSIKKIEITIEDTFIIIEDKTIRHHNNFESSSSFLFENNNKLENIFNFNNLIEKKDNAISLSLHVKDENLEQCLLLLKDKINKEFRENFNFDATINTVDNRKLKEYNIHFEDIYKKADNVYSFETNFQTLNKKDYKKFVEYFDNKIKAYEKLQNDSTIDSWIKIQQEIMPIKGLLKCFSEGIHNDSLKDKLIQIYSNHQMRNPKIKK